MNPNDLISREAAMGMTLIQAEKILNPETSAATLEEIDYLAGFRGQEEKAQAVEDACIIGAAAIREKIEREKTPVITVEPLDLLSEAIEDIPRRCIHCFYRQGWDTCNKAAFIDDGESCLNWQWEHYKRLAALKQILKKARETPHA